MCALLRHAALRIVLTERKKKKNRVHIAYTSQMILNLRHVLIHHYARAFTRSYFRLDYRICGHSHALRTPVFRPARCICHFVMDIILGFGINNEHKKKQGRLFLSIASFSTQCKFKR